METQGTEPLRREMAQAEKPRGLNADDGRDHSNHIRKYGIRLYSAGEMRALFRKGGFNQTAVVYKKGFMMPGLMVATAVK